MQEQDVCKVRNSFGSDYMPSGYRDVKVNAVIEGHVCEIQLQLRAFYDLKDGQHKVYEWARELNVTKEMRADDLFKTLSKDVTDKMITLAKEDWEQTRASLPFLITAAGDYEGAHNMLTEV